MNEYKVSMLNTNSPNHYVLLKLNCFWRSWHLAILWQNDIDCWQKHRSRQHLCLFVYRIWISKPVAHNIVPCGVIKPCSFSIWLRDVSATGRSYFPFLPQTLLIDRRRAYIRKASLVIDRPRESFMMWAVAEFLIHCVSHNDLRWIQVLKFNVKTMACPVDKTEQPGRRGNIQPDYYRTPTPATLNILKFMFIMYVDFGWEFCTFQCIFSDAFPYIDDYQWSKPGH